VTPFELGKIDWLTLIVSSTVNPVFEEIFVCAYIISALRKPLGINLAVAVSVAIRAAYHTYQGAPGFFYAALVGVIFGVWFASTNRLWPVILAHIVWDFIPLLPGVLQ
jgi:membrane protease YdiL (CAAX protease family)